MKVLIVCSKNSGRVAPFIVEQVESLCKIGVEADYFTVEGKGVSGYLKSRKLLLKKISSYQPDLIHAHYGLSGLLANLQRKVPVVTTYHGSDINNSKIFPLSKFSMWLSAYSIFVSEKNRVKSRLKNNYSLIPCGVNIDLFIEKDKATAREALHLDANRTYILFSGTFDNAVKNPQLAIAATELMPKVTLLALSGYTREQVVLLMNAVDAVLMTSFTEGSPQFIKEAMACNCPVVSVPVGDVAEVIAGVEGCYLCSYGVDDVILKLKMAIDFQYKTAGRKRMLALEMDSATVATRIMELYKKIVDCD